jgi:hypothetical protein
MLLREAMHTNKGNIKSLHMLSNFEKMRETTEKLTTLLPSRLFSCCKRFKGVDLVQISDEFIVE